MNKTKDGLDRLGKRILLSVKKELYMEMPYLARAIGNVCDVMDLNTFSVGTDGMSIRFNPRFLCENYLNFPVVLNRIYMHLLLHNLFMHPFVRRIRFENEDDEELWRLACDIAVESVIDSMDVDCLRMVTRDFREKWYGHLSENIRTLTAERIYRFLKDAPPYGEEWGKLIGEFCHDDHRFWMKNEGEEPDTDVFDEIRLAPMVNLPLREIWEKTAKAMESEIEQSGSKAMHESGRLSWNLCIGTARHRDFSSMLEKYMTVREVCSVDWDFFDLAYYQYGMQVYGDMPLIEELEGREEKRIETMVIAIDTSASTRRKHVVRFLTEIVDMLRHREYFFERIDLHIVECDDRIQKDIKLSRVDQIEEYIKDFSVAGGYGTDFRPVFSYISDLRKQGELKALLALFYFTDGYGIYPQKPTDFDTAFVFVQDEDYDDTQVPDWAVKLYLR